MSAFRLGRLIWAICLLGLLVAFGMNWVTGDEKTPPTPIPSASSSTQASSAPSSVLTLQRKPQMGCIVNESAIEDVQKQKEELEAKRKELNTKEQELKAKEHDLAEEIKKLSLAREDFSKAKELRKKENEEKVAKLVETFLSMSPKAASKVLTTLDEGLAVAVLSQMDTQKLAKILNVMDPAKSSQLSERIVGIESPRDRRPAQVQRNAQKPPSPAEKGGDRNDGHPVQSGSMEYSQPAGQKLSAEKDQKPVGP